MTEDEETFTHHWSEKVLFILAAGTLWVWAFANWFGGTSWHDPVGAFVVGGLPLIATWWAITSLGSKASR